MQLCILNRHLYVLNILDFEQNHKIFIKPFHITQDNFYCQNAQIL